MLGVLRAISEQMERTLLNQITDPGHPDVGAMVRPEWGIASPASTVAPIVSCGLLHLGGVGGHDWLESARLGIGYLLRVQHENGLIDLLSTNYDSGPDTAFAVQRLCLLIELGMERVAQDPAWAAFMAQVETFVRRAVPGVMAGGFHTPNHRWVVASALALAAKLLPGLDVQSVVDAYLAEGFDVDGEGAFIEHSAGVYDSVCDRSLLLLHDCLGAPGALETVNANLAWNLGLLHADGTIETGLSRRQDYGIRTVPLVLAPPYLWAANLTGDARLAATACFLWESATAPREDELNWLYYVLASRGRGQWHDVSAQVPSNYATFSPLNGIWRARRGLLSATLFRGASRLASLIFGQAELSSIKISQTYFGVGLFIAEQLSVADGVATLRSQGEQRLHRPGYELPLGRPVSPEQWGAEVAGRAWKPLPPCESTLAVREIEDGLELRYRTLNGLDGVMAQIALDFPPGGVWETGDTCTSTAPGQVAFLKTGYGSMRYGVDAIRIGPGADGHRMWAMRHAEPAPDHLRVLLTFRTPVDHVFTITCQRQTVAIRGQA